MTGWKSRQMEDNEKARKGAKEVKTVLMKENELRMMNEK